MSNSAGEVEKLRKEILLVAQHLSVVNCAMNYNLFIGFLSGEEFTAYVVRWKDRLEATTKKIYEATTVGDALKIASDFQDEIFAYAKATKVDTADKAMDIAHSFIKKYSPVALPLKAVKEGDVWLVDIDIGALVVKVAKVKVDARTGDILSYEVPEKR